MAMDIKSLVTGSTKTAVGKTQKSKKKSASKTESADDSADSVSLTGQASQISQLIHSMKAAPAVDMDRVSPVKEKVDSDKYEIEYERVADKMLDFESNYRR